MKKGKFLALLTHPFRKLYHMQHTVIDQQRLTLLMFCYLPIMILGVASNFLGLTQPTAKFFTYTHSICLLAAATFFILFYKKKITVSHCLSAFTIIGQVILTIEMTYCALQNTPYYKLLILANMVLLALNAMVSVCAYLKFTTIVLGFLTICTFVECSFLADDALLKSFIGVFVLAFFFVGLVGIWISKNTNLIVKENIQMKKDENGVLDALHMKKGEVKTLLSLAAKRLSYDGTRVLLETLSVGSRQNFLNNVEEYLKTKNTDLETIKRKFPEFTPSERDICRLMLQGKRLTNISIILGKSESNVSSQRANMRKKLGLKPEDNLLVSLQKRFSADAEPIV